MTRLHVKKIFVEKAVIKKVKDKMMAISPLARKIIDESTDKEIKTHGEMKGTTIRITKQQDKRLKRIKPHNFSRFINDKIKKKVE